MISFHLYYIGAQYYHCQFAENRFLHGSALVELAVPASISIMGNKKNSSQPTTIYSIDS